jgi:signal peptidase II
MSGNMARARVLLLIVAAFGTIGCDRVTKHAASAYLAGTPDRSFLSDTIRVGYVENTGGFLSLGADLPPIARDAVFTVATAIALVALLGLTLRRKYAGSAELGLVLFIAGGASNWIDRVLRGSVVDFLNMGIGPLRTGVFNMADVAIMLGAGLFVLGELGWNHKSGNRPAAGASSAARSTDIGPG